MLFLLIHNREFSERAFSNNFFRKILVVYTQRQRYPKNWTQMFNLKLREDILCHQEGLVELLPVDVHSNVPTPWKKMLSLSKFANLSYLTTLSLPLKTFPLHHFFSAEVEKNQSGKDGHDIDFSVRNRMEQVLPRSDSFSEKCDHVDWHTKKIVKIVSLDF